MNRPDWTHPDRMFSYHKPSEANVEKIRDLRSQHKVLAFAILGAVPECPERTLALRALHQCSMHANYALVADDEVAL